MKGGTMEVQSTDIDLRGSDMSEVELVGEKKLTWFDVSAIGSGEMIYAASWAWIIFIASLYGLKWTLLGFIAGVVLITFAWLLYREMITAVPEPGMIQSYGREARLFSLGTAYFLLYAPVYAAFMWLEYQASSGLLHSIFPSVPNWIWPILISIPIVAVNLLGHQITGKLQAALVAVILIGDVVVGASLWLKFDLSIWSGNWQPSTTVGWTGFLVATGLWVGTMAGILEVQQVVVDEWTDFKKSRDFGLIFGSVQLWVTQAIMAFGIMAIIPITKLAEMPVPPVGTVESLYGRGLLYALILIFMVASTFTTLNVFYMAMGRILALYAMQGALPRPFMWYSKKAVPWFSVIFLAVLGLVGAYWTNWGFIERTLAAWSTTLYIVVPIFFIGMRLNKRLERPYRTPGGIPIAVFLIALGLAILISLAKSDPKAVAAWFGLVVLVVLYDALVVPRTNRGKMYREQVLRKRTSASILE
jgi:amino acid transporter